MGVVFSFDHQSAVREIVHAADDVHHRRFAAARFAQDDDELMFEDIEVDAFEHL